MFEEEMIIPQVREVCEIFRSRGFQAYLVGGAVRDILRHVPPEDWDIATDALPDEVEKIFAGSFPSGIKYGTVSIIFGGKTLEITTMRRDGCYSDGRRPDQVFFTDDLRLDLTRRDFTINSMAYDPFLREIVDPLRGRADLARKILRAVGDPSERFREDALRMVRLFRFVSVLGFKPHRKTREALKAEWLVNVSAERIRDEISKLLMGERPDLGLEGLASTGLLGIIIPEARPYFDKKIPALNRRIWKHLLQCVKKIRPELHLRLAAFLHDLAKSYTAVYGEKGLHFYGHEVMGEEMSAAILSRLRFNKEMVKKVCALVRHHMFSINMESTDAVLRRFVNRVGQENVYDLLELRRADIIAGGRQEWGAYKNWQGLVDRIDCLFSGETVFTVKDLAVGGREVMDILKIPPGPRVGEILNKLWQLVVDEPELNTREKLVEILLKEYSSICREEP